MTDEDDYDEEYELKTCGVLSENQRKFVRDAKRSGLKVHAYSGRFMYGKYCPSVHVDRPNDIQTRTKVEIDSLGLGSVVYARV